MDAELCRRLGKIRSTPYWYYLAKKVGGITSDDWQEQANLITQEAIKAVSFDRLPNNIQRLIQRCEQSVEISQKLFGDKYFDSLSNEELEQIASQLFSQEPDEEIEEAA
ncbi:MAG: hypothetical protein KME52_18530 [Desmonostoc geniculatum HA4340-LM1]|jgi:hypothetical protein|nr:hypothetical protein [Desmonostoc geniculatum HA4340-LM1]